MTKKTLIKRLLFLAVFVAICLTLYIIGGFIAEKNMQQIKFNSNTWKNDDWDNLNVGTSKRERMIDDLTTNVLSGSTRKDIIYLLGEPDNQLFAEDGEHLHFFYGNGLVDPKCLIIVLDDNDNFQDFGLSECG